MALDNIVLENLTAPTIYPTIPSITLTDDTIAGRLSKVLHAMEHCSYDAIVIYADKEHGGNFEYLTGFIPRFEEALLILYSNGQSELLLGNENMKMANYARLTSKAIHAPWFSLPNQPMGNHITFPDLIRKTQLMQTKSIGIVGWKLFTSATEDNSQIYDVPYYIVDAIKKSLSNRVNISNATSLLISPKFGVRATNNANEIAHYEYGANLASSAILTALDNLAIGQTEKQIAAQLTREGQPNTVVTIAATGERFEQADLYPSDKKVKLGNKFSATVAYKGGLTCRTAYIANTEQDLAKKVSDYLDVVAKPYFNAVVHWLENIHIGMQGGQLYQMIESVYPKATYGWSLNPGHLVADEEWLSSPIFSGSEITLKSGMLLQIDIIPAHSGYGGVSIEDTIALANEDLQAEIAQDYPQLWARIQARRNYIMNELQINLAKEVLPLSNTVGYLRPYLLNKTAALKVKRQKKLQR